MTQEAYDAAIKGKEDPNKAREYNVDVEMKWQYYLRRIFEKRRNIYYGENLKYCLIYACVTIKEYIYTRTNNYYNLNTQYLKYSYFFTLESIIYDDNNK